MTATTTEDRKRKPQKPKGKAERKLDERLEGTFPASDPLDLTPRPSDEDAADGDKRRHDRKKDR
ncbi:hypothetical protein HW532_14625 [Kaustia mangrovi]|uniref:Uncharacterized protein n=1 Tax=Kaustia mangrovi TaxID=2593653 RepID=A0A7S8HCK1_9HYPH|nr:hypothetical protein [Kaustia mangrovi]QPC43812.1 hypothetical protein HW532_14625 [Kaustia mangrovi]